MKVAKIKKVLGYALGVQTLKKNIERGEEAIEKIKQQIEDNNGVFDYISCAYHDKRIGLISDIFKKYNAKPLLITQKNLSSLIHKFPLLEEQLKRKITNPYLVDINDENILAAGSNNPFIFSTSFNYAEAQIYYAYKQ